MATGDTKRTCTKQPGPSPCCNALEAGLVPRNGGIGQTFTYTSSSGQTRCAACEVVPSKSKKHPGQPVFKYHPKSCGASGCTALAAMRSTTGTATQPAASQSVLSLPSF
jgi:hypothetical protein